MRPLTVALAQFRPAKGRLADNLDLIERCFRESSAAGVPADVLVFPEAILTGYFLEGGVREKATTAGELYELLSERHARSGAGNLEACIGFYELHESRLYNSVMWASLGGIDAGIRHVHRKVFLPTYGVFDEERFVESGRDVRAFDTRIGRVAMLVCEDAWHSLLPTIAAVDGAQLVAIVAASPARGLVPDSTHPGQPGSQARWERLAREIAGEHGVYVALGQLVGFEGGKGFPGGSLLVAPDGEVLLRAPQFEDVLVSATVDLDAITRVRADVPLLADLEVKLPYLIESLDRARQRRESASGPIEAGEWTPRIEPPDHRVPPMAVVPQLEIDAELTRRWLVEFLRDEVRRLRRFENVIIGLSGGVDSAVVAFLAAQALGPERVFAIRMPYKSSSPQSLEHARLVVEATGIVERTVEITAAVDGYAAACGVPMTPERLGNVMARTRMITLFDLSAALGALPIGTGNKSERLLGYFTWHADDTPPVNPIGDLFKTQVWALARHLGVPSVIVDKPASADLVADQTDERDFGITYARADGILDLLLRGHSEATLLASGYTTEEIATVRKRLDGTHWKRRLPSTAMLSGTAIGEYYLRPVDY
jgi:NAD+ synthase (glutamine-hydrolysing)